MITKRRATSPATRKRAGGVRTRTHIILPNVAIQLFERIADAQEAFVKHARAESEKMDARVLKIDAEREIESKRQKDMWDEQERDLGTRARAPHPKSPPHPHRFPPEFFDGRRFCIVCGCEDREWVAQRDGGEAPPPEPRPPLRRV